MSRRKKIIVVILAILLILAAVLWRLFFGGVSERAPRAKPSDSVSSGVDAGFSEARTPVGMIERQNGADEAPQTDLRGLVSAFVERFGSYSNQSDFENIEDLYAFMTRRFQDEMEEYVRRERAKIASGAPYEGITTRALSVSKIREEAGQLVFQARALRAIEKSADGTRREDYQNIELTLQEEGRQWKVDSAEWQ